VPPLSRLRALARAGVFGTGALLAAAGGARAQGHAAPADTAAARLTLADALRTALDRNPQLQQARQQVRAGRGGVAAADAAFDPRVRTTVASNRLSDLSFAPVTSAATLADARVVTTRQQALDYRLSVEKQFRHGAVLVPEIGVSQVGVAGFAAAPANRASAGLNLVVPLARNRLGGVVTAGRRSAEAGLDAARADARHAAVQTAFETAAAYWDYAAAGERLAALRYAEQRAGALVQEAVELVRADAQPAATLQQFRGNLASKRAQRLAAEQAVAEARQRLGVVLGLGPADIAGLPPARLGGPPAAAAPAAPGPPDAAGVEQRSARWAADALGAALARRPDVRAAAARREAAAERVSAAASELRPRADLTVGVSYAGLTRGGGVNGFFSPLGGAMPGVNSVVQLQYELPARNLLARGRAEQADAALEQARIAERDLARQVEAALPVAAAGVERGRLALADAAEAVRLAREVVENEKQKFKLGVSTQIDVIYAEDALVSALLAEVGARRGLAAAVGALRFHAGDLAAAGEDPAALAAALAAPPARPGAPPAPGDPPDPVPNAKPNAARRRAP
jgi:outer membrane protein TolC